MPEQIVNQKQVETKAAHTPGPWFVEHTATCGLRIVHGEPDAKTGFRDDVAVGPVFQPSAEEIANVNLIAAAPDLLAALKACDNAFANWQIGAVAGRPEDIFALVVQVRDAVAKAQRR